MTSEGPDEVAAIGSSPFHSGDLDSYTVPMTDDTTFEKSSALGRRLDELVPGGGHTYAKGRDQFPFASPAVLTHGSGSHVWDVDGNEFIEYGMGLRAVGLGHAFPPVVEAVRASLELGTNFTRPAAIELEAAERFLDVIPTAEMVKFTKDGSTATTAAVKLARKATGRDLVAMCADHPFFSYDDWFISTTTSDGGIPSNELDRDATFAYNDLGSLRACSNAHPGRSPMCIMEPARLDPPARGSSKGFVTCATARGACWSSTR